MNLFGELETVIEVKTEEHVLMKPLPPRRPALGALPPKKKSLYADPMFKGVSPSTYAQGQPAKPAFYPELIDSALFLVDPIRPYPAWPLICKVTNMLAFEDEKAIKDWSPTGSLRKVYTCEHCGKLHAQWYPYENSGQSSGKSFRKKQQKEV